MTLSQLLEEYFPGEADDFLEMVLWGQTGWPGAWTGDPIDCLRMQLAVVVDKLSRCEFLTDWDDVPFEATTGMQSRRGSDDGTI